MYRWTIKDSGTLYLETQATNDIVQRELQSIMTLEGLTYLEVVDDRGGSGAWLITAVVNTTAKRSAE